MRAAAEVWARSSGAGRAGSAVHCIVAATYRASKHGGHKEPVNCLLPAAPAGSAGVEDVPDPRLQLSQQLIFSRNAGTNRLLTRAASDDLTIVVH